MDGKKKFLLQKQGIKIQTRHLINTLNNSYLVQMAFSKYMFPEHWKKNFGEK